MASPTTLVPSDSDSKTTTSLTKSINIKPHRETPIKTFYLVKPPPSIAHSPLNFQVQYVQPGSVYPSSHSSSPLVQPPSPISTNPRRQSIKSITSAGSIEAKRRLLPLYDLHFPFYFAAFRRPFIRRLNTEDGEPRSVAKFVDSLSMSSNRPQAAILLLSKELDGQMVAEPLLAPDTSVPERVNSPPIRHVGWRWIYRPRKNDLNNGIHSKEAFVIEWTQTGIGNNNIQNDMDCSCAWTCHLITLSGSVIYMGSLKRPKNCPAIAKLKLVNPLPTDMNLSESSVLEMIMCTAIWTIVQESLGYLKSNISNSTTILTRNSIEQERLSSSPSLETSSPTSPIYHSTPMRNKRLSVWKRMERLFSLNKRMTTETLSS